MTVKEICSMIRDQETDVYIHEVEPNSGDVLWSGTAAEAKNGKSLLFECEVSGIDSANCGIIIYLEGFVND